MLSLLEFVLAAALIVLLPGPDTLVVIRSLVRAGRAGATRTVVGVCTGLTTWIVVATVGVSAALRASHDGYLALRIAGAVYLCLLGGQALRSRGATAELTASPGAAAAEAAAPGAAAPQRAGMLGAGFLAGLMTDLLNPKVGVFFVTFLPAFIPANGNVPTWSLLLGGIFVVLTALYFVALIAFADRIMTTLQNPRLRKGMDRATGAVLIGFGARLALE